jgi:hypothetical protein
MQQRNFVRENNRWTSTGVGQICGTLMTYLRSKAKARTLPFEISAEQLWELYNRQEGKCALSGIPITLTTVINQQHNLDKSLMSASLDRIDNSKGYYIDNVQWIHKTLNAMRRQYSVEEYVYWCTLVANHANPEPSGGSDTSEGATTRDRDLRVSNIPTSLQPQSNLGEDIV